MILVNWSNIRRADLLRIILHYGFSEAVSILNREKPLGKPDRSLIDKQHSIALNGNHRVVFAGEDTYPSMLVQIPDPPALLFYKGNLDNLIELPCIAIIGSRVCSMYGRRVAMKLAKDFVQTGVVVVSGLARGIDGEAHIGALDAGGKTIAVIGTGLDRCYPSEHRELADMIIQSGLLLTEYPPLTEPQRYNFPERNRIVSGLSLGVVVVEAGERSGTMITVGTALDQSREVFAVPGEITHATSKGTNRLLRDGAGVVLSAKDVLEPLGLTQKTTEESHLERVSTEAAKKIVVLLFDKPMHFNIILNESALSVSDLQSELLQLEMAGIVRRHAGEIYSLS